MKSRTILLSALFGLSLLAPMAGLQASGGSESRNIEFELLDNDNAKSGSSESRNIEFELLMQHCASARAAALARGEAYQASELCREVEAAAH